MPSTLQKNPWPHLVLDNFLDAEVINRSIKEIEAISYKYDTDYRGSGRIEYSLLESPTLWRSIYSKKLIETLSKAFNAKISLNKENLIQLRRMNEDTPPFPLHNYFIFGNNSIVAFFYISKDWQPTCGGRLILNPPGNPESSAKPIDPIFNRLVAFQTKAEHWHSVEAVIGWERLSVLSVWNVATK